MPPIDDPIDRHTTHEQVRETLRQAILSGELPGGTRLVQAEIAGDLGVSITPVREALRDLANDQLIRLDAHRGGIVHDLTEAELREILDLRLLLETAAMRHAAERITPDQLATVRTIHREMRQAGDSPSWVMLNRRFHMTIYQAAGRPRLLGIVRNLLDASVMYVSAADAHLPRHRRRANDDHARILRLLADRDIDGVVEALERHIDIPRSVLAARG